MSYTESMTLDFANLFDLIFPPSKDELLLRHCQSLPKCAGQLKTDLIYLSEYHNAVVRAAVHLVKYHNHKKAKMLLAELLVNYLRYQPYEPILIIPIPLSQKRLRQRGYNQVEEVCKTALIELNNVQLRTDILTRNRDTTPQTSLNKVERLNNLTGAFSLLNIDKNAEIVANKKIILLDDVTTTGATLKEARATLAPLSPSSITSVALAH